MNNKTSINQCEVVCYKADVSTFERLGFTCTRSSPREEVVHMFHENPDCAAIATLISLGGKGLCFLASLTDSVIASDGNKCVWATANEARQPITTAIEDGRVDGYRRAVEYREVAAKVEALMRRDNAARGPVTPSAAE
jgi:hypothetical protein